MWMLMMQMRGKLIEFLRTSAYYRPTDLRLKLQTTTLFEELVIVYSKMSDHKCALNLLVNQLSGTH